MRLPEWIVERRFQEGFQRGAVIKYLMTDPDDRTISQREKYALIANVNTADPDSYLFLTTSRVGKQEPFLRRDPDAFHHFPRGRYSWVSTDTLLDLRRVKTYPRESLLSWMQNGSCSFQGTLDAADIAEIDRKLRSSQQLELRIIKKVVADE